MADARGFEPFSRTRSIDIKLKQPLARSDLLDEVEARHHRKHYSHHGDSSGVDRANRQPRLPRYR